MKNDKIIPKVKHFAIIQGDSEGYSSSRCLPIVGMEQGDMAGGW